jgi:hypothetical protein
MSNTKLYLGVSFAIQGWDLTFLICSHVCYSSLCKRRSASANQRPSRSAAYQLGLIEHWQHSGLTVRPSKRLAPKVPAPGQRVSKSA